MKALPPLGELTQEKLREILDYDPVTGIFQWRVRRSNSQVTTAAGTINSEGYRRIQIDGALYPASNLAWLYMTGTWPTNQVDHRNLDPSDDRFDNLREATQTQNKANSGVYRNNKLGVKGVRLHRNGHYEARLRVDGRLKYLGCFRTLEEAKAVYNAAAQKEFGEYANAG